MGGLVGEESLCCIAWLGKWKAIFDISDGVGLAFFAAWFLVCL